VALPVLADLKNYLRVTWTTEDATLRALLASATGLITAWIDRPIVAVSQTYVVEDPRASSTNVNVLSSDPRTGTGTLRIPDAPVASNPAPTITDADGNVVDPSMYRINYQTGLVRAANGVGFSSGGAFSRYPYTIVATTGLATRADYATVVEPCLFQAILDVAADLYQRRNPAATDENDGAGGSVRYGRAEEDLPIRATAVIAQFRRPPV
jgi:hypothetical protein